MRSFADLTHDEVLEMYNRCVKASFEYIDELNLQGVSALGNHGIYIALKTALFGAWEKAKNPKSNCLTAHDYNILKAELRKAKQE